MEEICKVLHQLVDDQDWSNLSALATALNSGEWEAMTDTEQTKWLKELGE